MCISNVTKIKNIQNIQVMANQNKTDIGLIGLAVMGENLALNMESKGWHVSVYNRTVPGVEEGVVERFLNGRAKGKNIEGFTDIKAFVDSIAKINVDLDAKQTIHTHNNISPTVTINTFLFFKFIYIISI